MAFRAVLSGTGQPGPDVRVTVTAPEGERLELAGTQLGRQDGSLVVDEIYAAEEFSALRSIQASGRWTIEVVDPDNSLQASSLTVEVTASEKL